MSGFEKKEYQSVILAALLHDVEKLLHRGGSEYNGTHENASSAFIKKFSSKIGNNKLYDIELIEVMVKHHHSTKQETYKDAYFSELEDNKKKIWKLITVVKRADTYSCAERELDQQRRKEVALRKAPLDSIFSFVNIEPAEQKEKDRKKEKYNLATFNPLSSFPASINELTDKEINDLIRQFENAIPDFSGFTSFDDVLNKWLSILEKYLWAVPSDTRYETSDVSPYDHLRSTAAIAACLYKRHIVAIEEGKKLDRTNEFIFIGGDFSGIQDYIFDITNRGSGGAAKRLRARSFFISVFSEATIHKILHSLDLLIVCNLFSSGGKFLLLAPNIEGLEIALQNVKNEIEREIHKIYFNQFSFLMAWMPIKNFKEKFKVYSFFRIADEMFHLLETKKARKSSNVLLNGAGKWNERAFVADEFYEEYQAHGACSICGKSPATHEENERDGEDEAVRCCFACYRDKRMGQRLPKVEFVAFGRGEVSKEEEEEGGKIVIFHKQEKDGAQIDYYAEFLEHRKESDEFYLIYDIGIKEDENKNRLIPLKKYYANHVPTSENRVLSFEDIAECSSWQKGDKNYGSSLIGVLKADVDNLGLIFSKGFENPDRAEKKLREIDRKTVSRYLTMSRMLDLFFSGWVKEIMSYGSKEVMLSEFKAMNTVDCDRLEKYINKGDVINFKNIYTVYSGGDDLVLVGPWETMVVFSIFLNMQFRRFTCYNKDITLSAGMAIVKPKHPIASAIKQADGLLEKSKEQGKDRITFFGTIVKWEKMPELMNFFLFLDGKLSDDNSNVNPAFLYRLLQYHRMALSFLDEDKIEGLKYLSALSYDMGRNIIERDKKGVIKKGHQEQSVFQSLINQRPDKNSIIYNMKIPLFWALYRNRRISKNETSR